MKPHCLTLVLFSAAMLALAAPEALAQSRTTGGGGSSSLFGSGSSSFGGGSSFGGSSSVGTSLGGSSFGGQGGLGGGRQTGFGGGGMGQGGQGLGFGGQPGGGAAGGFIGRDAADVSSFFNALNPLGGQGGGGAGQSRGAMNRGRDVNSTEDVRPPLMVRVRVAFDTPPTTMTRLAPNTENRLNGILTTRGLQDAQVTVRNGVAVISGSIPTASDRRLINRLVRLEPGVDRVVDETVSETTPLPTPLLP
jgi:hypothetical protein